MTSKKNPNDWSKRKLPKFGNIWMWKTSNKWRWKKEKKEKSTSNERENLSKISPTAEISSKG